MLGLKKVRRALISVYNKGAAHGLIATLDKLGVELVSTGGTLDYIRSIGINAISVESLSHFPPILGGRVKTLHPSIFGAILARTHLEDDVRQLSELNILPIDMVVVDLYPFEMLLSSGADHSTMIENIDIGGISLIRAAAKNYSDVLVVPAIKYFGEVSNFLNENNGSATLDYRMKLAAAAFDISSEYDTAIFNYLNQGFYNTLKLNLNQPNQLRYGENPHQQGVFFGNPDELIEQIQGKPLSYNNILDLDAALQLIAEFEQPAFAVIKHTNACGVAVASDIEKAFENALSSDPVSAFGGVFVANRNITLPIARKIKDIFFEVLIAPGFDESTLDLLLEKKTRIVLKQKNTLKLTNQFRQALNGVLWQNANSVTESYSNWKCVTNAKPSEQELTDLRFACKVVKHLKSNAIVLAKGEKLLGIGVGQTSRVDALKQAITKAQDHGHDLEGAVMASDAFFPFVDCVVIANMAGINAIVQPGGSVKDQDSVDYCNNAGISMIFTGLRHFKH
ncbi:MAG TPA: bifunctional phosphoribosylaminoimidazolecarboxamide formyltransferase/IMP cyclohydrolase [Bacteroidales bacterium]|nr:bifunctional phosphoribosylaminoimidazolecarboxamide formyltransferase/IMP cyclohydrolase [Bacteroidales bacterium]